jgi:hypothetical protein
MRRQPPTLSAAHPLCRASFSQVRAVHSRPHPPPPPPPTRPPPSTPGRRRENNSRAGQLALRRRHLLHRRPCVVWFLSCLSRLLAGCSATPRGKAPASRSSRAVVGDRRARSHPPRRRETWPPRDAHLSAASLPFLPPFLSWVVLRRRGGRAPARRSSRAVVDDRRAAPPLPSTPPRNVAAARRSRDT